MQVWNVIGVMNYLQALIEKSMILQILDEEKDGNVTFTATDGYDYHGGTNVLEVLGYFSIVGLLRVHCLLGDYQSGLHALSPIDINQPGVFNTVIGCQITTIYYYGFAKLMLRRYSPSSVVLLNALLNCMIVYIDRSVDSTTLSDLPSPLRGFFFVLTCCRLRSGIWMQSNPSTKSFYIFSRPSSITNGRHSMIKS